jgi:hypothetical protein
MLQDMYEKMVQIDGNAPTEEEHRLKGVTKPRLVPLLMISLWSRTIQEWEHDDTVFRVENFSLKMEASCSYKMLISTAS